MLLYTLNFTLLWWVTCTRKTLRPTTAAVFVMSQALGVLETWISIKHLWFIQLFVPYIHRICRASFYQLCHLLTVFSSLLLLGDRGGVSGPCGVLEDSLTLTPPIFA